MFRYSHRFALTMALTVSSVVLAARGHLLSPKEIETKTGEATVSREWNQKTSTMDEDTCTMAVMHHARKIYQSLSQTEARLNALIPGNRSSASSNIKWVERPQINPKSEDKIRSAVASLEAAKIEVERFAGRSADEYAQSTIVAKNHCTQNLILGSADDAGVLDNSNNLIAAANAQVAGLFDNGDIDMKRSSFEGFSEIFLAPIYSAQNEVSLLGNALTGPAKTGILRAIGGGKSTTERLKPSALKKLEEDLRNRFPLAFTSGKAISNSDKEKQMIAANKSLFEFLKETPISYGDAANLWKMDLIRPTDKGVYPSSLLNNAIVDKIESEQK